uniref:Transposase domain-containing protein n=1 Tax=Rhizophagus irregularis (strain DAOM 181602 / DAOM 197198 / MUCL 43194) TaxID=747089 RepID=U9ULB8_RHIID
MSNQQKSEVKRRTKVCPKVPCPCKLYNGKIIDSRTRSIHINEENRLEDSVTKIMESRRKNRRKNSSSNPNNRPESASVKIRSDDPDDIEPSQDLCRDEDIIIDQDQYEEPVIIRKKGVRYNRFQFREMTIIPDEEPEQQVDSSGDEEGSRQILADDDVEYSEDDELFLDDDDGMFTAPASNYDYDSNQDNMDMDVDDLWILLWIFKFQERFRQSDVAIDTLIGFFSLVLKDANSHRFKKFPPTLYDIASIIPANSNDNEFSGFKCTHVEFPKHPMQKYRECCGSELLMKVPVNNGYIWRPKMLYPLSCLKSQLSIMYQRSGFEQLLKKWINRDNVNCMSDIYDGEIWKNFPSRLDIPDPLKFFTSETAELNLGIMINLDWFQPFDLSIYSLLPGPHEVKLHQINHYLAPIVDELLELWNGFILPPTDKYPSGKKI